MCQDQANLSLSRKKIDGRDFIVYKLQDEWTIYLNQLSKRFYCLLL